MGRRVGIVGGNGWLGSAIGRAMLEAGVIEAAMLCVSSRGGSAPSFAAWPGVEIVSDNAWLAEHSDVIVMSVRPQQFPAVKLDARGKLVVSVMAGVDTRTLAERCGTDRVVRAMPNAAAEIGLSYSPWFAGSAVTAADKAFVRTMFEACGTTDEVADEAAIDYLTALSGSGPAFPGLLANAMLSHALASGLDRDVATRAVLAVVADAGRMLRRDGAGPQETVRAFLDYRGTTAAGLQAMIGHGFEQAVHAGLDAARSVAIQTASHGQATDEMRVGGRGAADATQMPRHRQSG